MSVVHGLDGGLPLDEKWVLIDIWESTELCSTFIWDLQSGNEKFAELIPLVVSSNVNEQKTSLILICSSVESSKAPNDVFLSVLEILSLVFLRFRHLGNNLTYTQGYTYIYFPEIIGSAAVPNTVASGHESIIC